MMSCVLIEFAIKFVIIDIKHAHYQQNLNKCFNHSNTLVVWVEIYPPQMHASFVYKPFGNAYVSWLTFRR